MAPALSADVLNVPSRTSSVGSYGSSPISFAKSLPQENGSVKAHPILGEEESISHSLPLEFLPSRSLVNDASSAWEETAELFSPLYGDSNRLERKGENGRDQQHETRSEVQQRMLKVDVAKPPEFGGLLCTDQNASGRSEVAEKLESAPVPPSPPPQLKPSFSGSNSDSGKSTGTVCVSKELVDMWDSLFVNEILGDVEIRTDDGGVIVAHTSLLVASSPVWCGFFESALARTWSISIRGVPHAAARAFIRFLYSSRCSQEEMEKYVVHLLVLSHAYCIPSLKRACTEHFENGGLNYENVVDIFQLARLCDFPRLALICFRRIMREFKVVARTEGWRAMRQANPAIEQELVEAVIDADNKKRARTRKLEEDKVYEQLLGAMEALVHICRDGCHGIGPCGDFVDERVDSPGYCGFPACDGLAALVWHFAGCKVKVTGGCVQCKHMWQLLELHSRICQDGRRCRVPLCRHFKENVGHRRSKKATNRWRLLVNKVLSAKKVHGPFTLAAVAGRLELMN